DQVSSCCSSVNSASSLGSPNAWQDYPTTLAARESGIRLLPLRRVRRSPRSGRTSEQVACEGIVVVRRLAYNRITMGFRDARQRVIRSLLAGNWQIEIRDVVEGKNLLERGEVTPAEVVELLQRCRGNQYQCTPHHADASVPVHVFLPVLRSEQWYIKAYL